MLDAMPSTILARRKPRRALLQNEPTSYELTGWYGNVMATRLTHTGLTLSFGERTTCDMYDFGMYAVPIVTLVITTSSRTTR